MECMKLKYTTKVTILILIDGFLQYEFKAYYVPLIGVTILILIDGFLQYEPFCDRQGLIDGHNPYFNRWFSAIMTTEMSIVHEIGHNPYFNRWFSAIRGQDGLKTGNKRHNPYFNRWFSAII